MRLHKHIRQFNDIAFCINVFLVLLNLSVQNWKPVIIGAPVSIPYLVGIVINKEPPGDNE